MKHLEQLPAIEVYNIFKSNVRNLKIHVRIWINPKGNGLLLQVNYLNGISQYIPIIRDSRGRYKFSCVDGLCNKVYFDGIKFTHRWALIAKGYKYKSQYFNTHQRRYMRYIDLLFDAKDSNKAFIEFMKLYEQLNNIKVKQIRVNEGLFA